MLIFNHLLKHNFRAILRQKQENTEKVERRDVKTGIKKCRNPQKQAKKM